MIWKSYVMNVHARSHQGLPWAPHQPWRIGRARCPGTFPNKNVLIMRLLTDTKAERGAPHGHEHPTDTSTQQVSFIRASWEVLVNGQRPWHFPISALTGVSTESGRFSCESRCHDPLPINPNANCAKSPAKVLTAFAALRRWFGEKRLETGGPWSPGPETLLMFWESNEVMGVSDGVKPQRDLSPSPGVPVPHPLPGLLPWHQMVLYTPCLPLRFSN